MAMTKDEMIDRCIAIEEEYKSLDTIYLSPEDYEDISDRYQAKLELRWHKDELESEYNELNKLLGLPNKRLY